jgi:hypothetical protein
MIVPNIDEGQRNWWSPTVTLLLENPTVLCDDLPSAHPQLPPKDYYEQRAILNNAIELINLINHFDLYEGLYNEYVLLFTNLTKHCRHKVLRLFYEEYFDQEVFFHIWTISTFIAITAVQSVITTNATHSTKIYSAVLEHSCNTVFSLLDLFPLPHEKLPTLTLKKYINICLQTYAQSSSSIKIRVEKKSDLISLREFFAEQKPEAPHTNQVTVLIVMLTFLVNLDRRYFITNTPVRILYINNKYYTYLGIRLLLTPLLIQHYAKGRSTITSAFVEATHHLATTGFTVDFALVEMFEAIVKAEVELVWKKLQELTSLDIQSIEDAKGVLGKTSRKLLTTKHIRNALQQMLLRNVAEDAPSASITELAKKTHLNSNLLRSIFTKNKTEEQLIYEARELQAQFSKLYLYTNYLTYGQYLRDTERTTIHFTPYSDFRGRLYYKSEASPQSIWCFRFIYYYHRNVQLKPSDYPLYPYQQSFISNNPHLELQNPALLEFFQAIGVLFKSKCINTKDGSVNLNDLLNQGVSFYTRYKDHDPVQIPSEIDIKDYAEFLYYKHAIESERVKLRRGYYIWKDTTASVVQHGGKLLGYKPEMLPQLNLNNEFIAYDTYQVVINELKATLGTKYDIPASVLSLLSRKVLKQLIMTCEYQVSFQTAYNRYTHTVTELANKDTRYQLLLDRALFKHIYDLLKAGLVAKLFYKETQDEWFSRNSVSDLAQADICFTTTYHPIAYNMLYFEKGDEVRRARTVIKTITPIWEHYKVETPPIDKRKTKQAAYVNFVHAHDAIYLRKILRAAKRSSVEIAAVHDGFGVAYYNSKWLMGAANSSFWERGLDMPFSHTIIL